jgi:hypothetical protein
MLWRLIAGIGLTGELGWRLKFAKKKRGYGTMIVAAVGV